MLIFNMNSRYYSFEYNIMSMEFDETFIIRYGK